MFFLSLDVMNSNKRHKLNYVLKSWVYLPVHFLNYMHWIFRMVYWIYNFLLSIGNFFKKKYKPLTKHHITIRKIITLNAIDVVYIDLKFLYELTNMRNNLYRENVHIWNFKEIVLVDFSSLVMTITTNVKKFFYQELFQMKMLLRQNLKSKANVRMIREISKWRFFQILLIFMFFWKKMNKSHLFTNANSVWNVFSIITNII